MKTVNVEITREDTGCLWFSRGCSHTIIIDGEEIQDPWGKRYSLLLKYAGVENTFFGTIKKKVVLPDALVNTLCFFRRTEPLVEVVHLKRPTATSDSFLDEHWSDAVLDKVSTSGGLMVTLMEHHGYGTRRGQGGVEMTSVLVAKDRNGQTYRASEVFRHRTDPSKDRLHECFGETILTAYFYKDSVLVETNKQSFVRLRPE